jgi:hypothetical protein
MSRGSKPGERRGGRKLGTPNKKTLLRHAFIDAVAADPNLLPLDFFLRLMHQPTLPLAIRVHAAEDALPFVHAKPPRQRNYQLHSPKVVAPSQESNCGARPTRVTSMSLTLVPNSKAATTRAMIPMAQRCSLT